MKSESWRPDNLMYVPLPHPTIYSSSVHWRVGVSIGANDRGFHAQICTRPQYQLLAGV